MKHHVVSDNNYNIMNLYCPIFLYKERQMMLGIHLVLGNVLHGRFTISNEQK